MPSPMQRFPDEDPYDKPEPEMEPEGSERFKAVLEWISSRPKWILVAAAVACLGLISLMIHSKPSASHMSATYVPITAKPVVYTPKPMPVVSKHTSPAPAKKSHHKKKRKRA